MSVQTLGLFIGFLGGQVALTRKYSKITVPCYHTELVVDRDQ